MAVTLHDTYSFHKMDFEVGLKVSNCTQLLVALSVKVIIMEVCMQLFMVALVLLDVLLTLFFLFPLLLYCPFTYPISLY